MNAFTDRYRPITFGAIVALTIYVAATLLVPFLPALLWAAVICVLVYPIHKRYRNKFGPNFAALITTLLTIALIGVPLALVGTVLTLQVTASAHQLAQTNGTADLSLDQIFSEFDKHVKPIANQVGASDFSLKSWFDQNRESIVKGAGAAATAAAKATGQTLFTLVVAFLTLFFMLRDGHRLREPALELIPLPRERAEKILERMEATIHAVFVGIVLVALIQGAIAGIMYWITGVPSPMVWWVATTVLCAIPLLGAPIIYVPMGLLLLAQGKVWEAVALLGVGFLVVSQVDNLLRPFIIGARVELHPIAIFFSLLGGIFTMGPVGIMIGPVVLTVLLALQEVIRERLAADRERESEAVAMNTPAVESS